MKIQKTGTTCEVYIEGPLGEVSPLFSQEVRGLTRLVIDGEKMTYMNSIGVKNWIMWTTRITKNCQFVLRKVPLLMINQASQVLGFLPEHGIVESFNAPYICESCNTEVMVLLVNGRDFEYPTSTATSKINLPKRACPKCKAVMEPDFMESKVFMFLERR